MRVGSVLTLGREILLSQGVAGNVVKDMRRFELEQSLINGLLLDSGMSRKKLDLADFLGKIIECRAIRLPNVNVIHIH